MLASRLARVLAAVAADPGLRVHQAEILDPAERRLVVRDWNDTATARPGLALPGSFAAQAARAPDAVAVVRGRAGQLPRAETGGRGWPGAW